MNKHHQPRCLQTCWAAEDVYESAWEAPSGGVGGGRDQAEEERGPGRKRTCMDDHARPAFTMSSTR